MSQKTIKRVHTCYGIAVSVLLVLLGVLLILSCVDIYESGDRPFSREAVAAHFSEIAPIAYIALAAVLGGGLLSLVLPLDTGKTKPIREESAALARISARLGDTARKDSACRREKRIRITLRVVTALVVILSAVYPVLYLADASHFTIANLNADVVKAISFVLAATAVSLAVSILCTYLCTVSVKREIARAKVLLTERLLTEQIQKENIQKEQKNDAPQEDGAACTPARSSLKAWMQKHKRVLLAVLRCVLFVVGALLCVLGVLNDGVRDVLLKATQICTECVGIG